MNKPVKDFRKGNNSTFSVTPTGSEISVSMLTKLQNLVSDFISNGEGQEVLKSFNFLLNEFVSSDEFEKFNKTFRKNLVHDITKTMVFLSAISEQSNQIKNLNERSLS